MTTDGFIIGLDVGSVTVTLALVTPEGEVLRTAGELHRGDVRGGIERALEGVDLARAVGLAATSSTPDLVRADRRCDDRVAVITATRHFHERVGSILIVGGEKFGLVLFDREGRYRGFRSNTSCAAGTGSFLDQQAARLNLGGSGELSLAALANRGRTPKIATRCAVFAKTDLAHAQQEGFGLEEICDGLCRGLARNIADTLFSGERPQEPIIFTGGVAKNQAVVRHLEEILGRNLVTDPTGAYGAVGAALLLARERSTVGTGRPWSGAGLFGREEKGRLYFHEPLELRLSHYPDFEAHHRYEFVLDEQPPLEPVEVDLYLEPPRPAEVYLGLDIGSTSTKAVLTTAGGEVLAGFYTRTAGRPVDAVRALLAAMDDLAAARGLEFDVLGAGTTGSGRKFMARIIGADLVLDEITAHARAGVELDPQVDTILEIGGQDSKFTTLSRGRVTSAHMNTVCAAGTGSFIEEQARRLGCPLSEYSARAEGRRAPLASDRCTVFMERDLNHYLREGYSKGEVLAAVLHSVCENYLTKVAVEKNIGRRVLFQGATAKNRALAAAFEQRLGRPVHVSRYCHLTGALGVALTLKDQGLRRSGFKGLYLHRRRVPLRTEVCEVCTNHCKIVVAEVGAETAAYGFLCGRDYGEKRFVDRNRSGFDLLKARRKVFSFARTKDYRRRLTIGLPAALHLLEDLPFWQYFFDRLSIRTVTSEDFGDAVKEGKRLAGADFCAPLAALHGHVRHLLDRCDYVFLPVYLERKAEEKGFRRQYCYYTQFAPALASLACGDEARRVLRPLVHYLYSGFHARREIYRELKRAWGGDITFLEVAEAYARARAWDGERRAALTRVYLENRPPAGGLHVVLLGRPYTLLSPAMNKGLPGLFAAHGVRVFYLDMFETGPPDESPLGPLLREVRWLYGARVLAAAETAARTPGAYPVLVTSFKCAPDSFIAEYFKEVMEAHHKPYLILQLDEHDSNVGYETRIEAALRAFANHFRAEERSGPPVYPRTLIPETVKDLRDKVLYLPNWDEATCRLLAANLQGAGVDARVLEQDPTSIRRSLRHNTGQCLPLNIIAQEFADTIEKDGVDPAR
ncbi:MAG: acyl-CoA dehydratase activase, partial [Thermodesulfobacteriota bacterium]